MKILAVDDDNLVRRGVVRALIARGHEVISAADPVDAAYLYEAVDVVLSDWDMPNGGGQRVLDESTKPVVIHSGAYFGTSLAVRKGSTVDDIVAALELAMR